MTHLLGTALSWLSKISPFVAGAGAGAGVAMPLARTIADQANRANKSANDAQRAIIEHKKNKAFNNLQKAALLAIAIPVAVMGGKAAWDNKEAIQKFMGGCLHNIGDGFKKIQQWVQKQFHRK